jgi:hypothetical protein
VLKVPDEVVLPNGSNVYCVWTVPAEFVSAPVLPNASVKKFAVPLESVRVKYSS